MAVTVDSVGGDSFQNGAGSTVTWSHTVGAGSDRVLIAQLASYNGAGFGPVTGVTFGGVAMTEFSAIGINIPDFTVRSWYLVAPTVSTANVVATYPSGGHDVSFVSISLFGVNQATPLANAIAYGSGVDNVNVTTAAGDMAIDLVPSFDPGLATGGGTRFFYTFGAAANAAAAQRKAAVGATTNLSWTNSVIEPDAYAYRVQQSASPPGSSSMGNTIGFIGSHTLSVGRERTIIVPEISAVTVRK